MTGTSKPKARSASTHERFPLATVARLTGLTPDLIRAWERRYSAVRPERGPRGARVYRTADIDRLRLLGAVVQSGRAIGDVAHLGNDELRRLLAAAPPSPAPEVSTAVGAAATAPPEAGVVQEIVTAVQRYDQARIEARLAEALLALGGCELAKRVLAPLLHDVGERWMRGELTVAHEHFLSGILRHLVADLVRARRADGAARVLLATPPGEQHEFGILLAALILCDAGVPVRYLGANVPAADIVSAAAAGVEVIGLSTVHSENRPRAVTTVRDILRLGSPTVQLWLGGRDAHAVAAAARHPRVQVVSDLEELGCHASERWRGTTHPNASSRRR